MTTLPNQKQNPTPHPYPYPDRNPNPNSTPSSGSKPLTLDEVSKFFSLPLSDAADSLGVCTSVLKKICHDNGLVRWPYRKVRAGKSIEEIKQEAAREKKKHLSELPKASAQMNDASAGSIGPSSLGFQLETKTTSSVQELSKSQIVMQQQGNKNVQTGSPPKLHGSTLIKGSPGNLDEFKYGFPSDCLSTVSYRWWGNSSTDVSKDSQRNAVEEIQGSKQASMNSDLESGTASSTTDGENGEDETERSNTDSSGTGSSLSALRKRALNEGREAMKLGVHRRYNINKLDQSKKMVLLQIFKSSLPSQWRDGSF